ncbi:MAG: hypothetical protein PHP52_05090 [Bacteroidales bacterium]|nr:hypothetical protein [Bacteroidales bacterium]MDD4216345.1 hypothetical protein [Bacteroidales bacterium]
MSGETSNVTEIRSGVFMESISTYFFGYVIISIKEKPSPFATNSKVSKSGFVAPRSNRAYFA